MCRERERERERERDRERETETETETETERQRVTETETETDRQTFCTPSHNTDTGPTSPSTDLYRYVSLPQVVWHGGYKDLGRAFSLAKRKWKFGRFCKYLEWFKQKPCLLFFSVSWFSFKDLTFINLICSQTKTKQDAKIQ